MYLIKWNELFYISGLILYFGICGVGSDFLSSNGSNIIIDFFKAIGDFISSVFGGGCQKILMEFKVEIDEKLGLEEFLGLTGDIPELGNWSLDRSIPMRYETENSQWTFSVILCKNIDLSYRYFTYAKDTSNHKKIHRWEGNLEPRHTRCSRKHIRVDKFGNFNQNTNINLGWLRHETVVQFKFERDNILNFKTDYDVSDGVLVKVVPQLFGTDLPMQIPIEATVEVVKMVEGKSILKPQETVGIVYKPEDTIIFHITVSSFEITSYAIFFSRLSGEQIGQCKLFPKNVSSSRGVLSSKINNGLNEVGQANIPFLVIKPIPFFDQYDFRISFQHNWLKQWYKLDTGHRGLGPSFTRNPAPMIENTIASYEAIYNLNGDGIQLSVQLTRDLVPVVFHDFGFFTAAEGVEPKSQSDLIWKQINDVTYNDLKNFHIYYYIEGKIQKFPSYNSELDPKKRIFVSLAEVFQALPLALGINVKLKYPQELEDGTDEYSQTIEMNVFVDRVISITQKFGTGRPLILTSLDPDICTMIQLKQNLISNGFITYGEIIEKPNYVDRRTKTVQAAINQVQAFQSIAVVVNVESVLMNSSVIYFAAELGKVFFVWGPALNSLDRINFLKDHNVAILIYDRMDLKPPSKPRQLFDNNDARTFWNSQRIQGYD